MAWIKARAGESDGRYLNIILLPLDSVGSSGIIIIQRRNCSRFYSIVQRDGGGTVFVSFIKVIRCHGVKDKLGVICGNSVLPS